MHLLQLFIPFFLRYFNFVNLFSYFVVAILVGFLSILVDLRLALVLQFIVVALYLTIIYMPLFFSNFVIIEVTESSIFVRKVSVMTII